MTTFIYKIAATVITVHVLVPCNVSVEAEFTSYLDETDVFSVLPEALATHVESVFADQAVSVRAYPAGIKAGAVLNRLNEQTSGTNVTGF